MKNKKTVAVKIGQMTYNLSADENSQYIEDIAEEADRLINQIKANNPDLSSTNIAILALVNALDKKTKEEVHNAHIAENAEEYQTKLNTLKTDLKSLRETCWELKKELLYYKNLCEVYQERIDELNQISNSDKLTNKLEGTVPELKPLDRLQTSFSEINQDPIDE